MQKGWDKEFIPNEPVICITKSSLRRFSLPTNKPSSALRSRKMKLTKKTLKNSHRKHTIRKYKRTSKKSIKRLNRIIAPAVGLSNIGTNCYVNSGIQFILCVPELNSYFLEENFTKGFQNTEGIKFCRAIAEVYKKLFTSQQAASISFEPMTDLCPTGQNDTHEFFTKNLFPCLSNEYGVANNSIQKKAIVEFLFGGVLANKITCKGCNKVSIKHDTFLDLSLAIYGNTLEECLDQYFIEEELNENEAYFCERCNSFQSAIKEVKIHQCPKYLILHLKRLLPGERKITKQIKYTKDLDLTKFAVGDVEGKYELQAVCIHIGCGIGGHFITFAKRGDQVSLL